SSSLHEHSLRSRRREDDAYPSRGSSRKILAEQTSDCFDRRTVTRRNSRDFCLDRAAVDRNSFRRSLDASRSSQRSGRSSRPPFLPRLYVSADSAALNLRTRLRFQAVVRRSWRAGLLSAKHSVTTIPASLNPRSIRRDG